MKRLALVMLVIGCRGGDRPAPVENKPVVADEPAPVPTEDGTLVIPATRIAGGYELRLGTGRIVLSLDKHTLVAPDPTHGAAALEVLAKWLGVPVPPKTHAQPLQPLAFEMIGLGESDNKVFFQRGADYAEMYINIHDAQHTIEFVPKDSGYANALADMFADALRDGPAPPRTTKTDPNLATDEPRFRAGPELAAARGGHKPTCLGDGWLIFKPAGAREAAWFATWGAAPAKLCELTGAIDQVAVAQRAAVAVAVVTRRDPTSHVIGGDQKSTLWRIDPSGCRAIATPKDLDLGPFTFPHLSPTGSEVAIMRKDQVVTFPIDKGTPTAAPAGELDLIYVWDHDGIELQDFEGKHSRMKPGEKPAPIPRATAASPDGVYTVGFRDGMLDITDRETKATRGFGTAFRGDMRAIERARHEAPEWVGPHGLVLRGSPDQLLDLGTLRTRPLTSVGTVACASPDGAHALITREDTLAESQ